MAEHVYTVGNYLATRLEQIGLKHYFVVPGDYNLMLLDQLLWKKQMEQIGCCNELNASYAAEGYARVNGAAVVVVTFNVGAFSALNGIASAYAENLPVIFISGSYNTNDPTRVEMVRQIKNYLDSNTTLLVESGDSWFTGTYMRLPEGARFEIEMQWGSIGWSVPATFGYSLGLEAGRRVVAMIGDGSFQLTAQEVSSMIRYGCDNITIFLLNNHGYIIETAIHEGPYNYYKNWNYAALVDAWNAEDGR